MSKILELIKKGEDANNRLIGYCGLIVNEAIINYKKTREQQEEEEFIFDLGCFIQAGDGFVYTDSQGSNVPVSVIDGIIEQKGFFDYEDFMNSRI
jgi:hypothetical protein